MSVKWPMVRLGEVLTLDVDAVAVVPTDVYPMAGVYSFGRGLFHRSPLLGAETTYPRLHRLRTGQIVLSQLKAWEGAIARVTDAFDGNFLSPQFPTFRPRRGRADATYVEWYCRLPALWAALQRGARGMGARRDSVSPERFLDVELPLPPLPEQRRIVATVESAARLIDRCRDERATAGRQLEGLLLGAYSRLIEGAERCPMRGIAPVVRRPVEVHPDRRYLEIGTRSFGRGLFRKPPVDGLVLGDKRVYTIRRGDLIFMNVFAWEGAVAVASDAEDGLIGSHRYITCVPEPHTALSQFLCFHFLTPRGLSELGEASPGGAGRNRTLGVEKLERIEVPVPHLDRQKMFVELMMQVEHVRSLHEDCSALAQGLMKSHVHRLLGAETEVPGASS
ncbi:MAG: restriction endonuclease subunit S [Candidatus Eisenbacteria bacterium]|nr:restriction endonuclease subunit S [Candidatus Eisenbacteria bacterium]